MNQTQKPISAEKAETILEKREVAGSSGENENDAGSGGENKIKHPITVLESK